MSDTSKTWLDFLAGQPLLQPVNGSGFVAPLSQLGLIRAEGEDAASFLHNQLTNDVLNLDESGARLAGYCTPKGRLLATMLIWKTQDHFFLQVPRAILHALQKRLQMFVMRSRLKLTDVSEDFVILGLSGANAALLGSHFPQLPVNPYSTVHNAAGTLIRVAAAAEPRYQLITTPEQAQAVWPLLTRVLRPAPESQWNWSEIMAGIPQVTAATQEQFVPQMINYEIIGGVNFRKGCYPGQEIVARSQYLGKFKRRMLLASVDAADAQAGMEVFSDSDPDQPCGLLVNGERSPEGTFACLVEMKLDATGAGVHLGSATGPQLHFMPLPYALPDPA